MECASRRAWICVRGWLQRSKAGNRRIRGDGAAFDRDCDGRDMGAAEAVNRGLSSCQQGKPKGAVLDAHAAFILGALAEAPPTVSTTSSRSTWTSALRLSLSIRTVLNSAPHFDEAAFSGGRLTN